MTQTFIHTYVQPFNVKVDSNCIKICSVVEPCVALWGPINILLRELPLVRLDSFCVRENLLCDIHQTFIGSLLISVQLADVEDKNR